MGVHSNYNELQPVRNDVYHAVCATDVRTVSRVKSVSHPSGVAKSSTNHFYRAMLCIRGTSHGPVSVCLSVCVCLSQASVLLKRQNVGSHKQHHTIPQGL